MGYSQTANGSAILRNVHLSLINAMECERWMAPVSIRMWADSEALLLGNLLLAAQAYAKSIGIADDGYRVVMNCNRNGGQTVFHIHMHLLGGAPLTGGFA